jgi:two-component system, cell cycle sensor histidine kinase and response regulator CckA
MFPRDAFEQNQEAGSVHTVRDGVEIVESEEPRDAGMLYRHLFLLNSQPMWFYDRETLRFLEVNEAAVRFYGYTRAEFLSMTIKDIRPPEDIPLTLSSLPSPGRAVCQQGSIFRHMKKDGTHIYVEIVSHELPFEDRPARLVQMTDVTERRRAESALRASEERFHAFMDNSPTLAFIKDEEGRYIYISRPLESFFKRMVEDGVGKTDADILPEEIARSLCENDAVVLTSGQAAQFVENLPALDGEMRSFLTFKFLIIDPSGRRLLAGIAVDITEQRAMEAQLLQSQKMECVGALAGGVAHDFNNLLTVVNGYGDLALRRLEEEDPLRPYIEEIRKAGERAARLTRQLLAFSRKQILQPKILDLNEHIAEANKMLHRLIGEHIEIVLALHPNVWKVKVDPSQLDQVLVNLAVNARDAMPHGGRLSVTTNNVVVDSETARRGGSTQSGQHVLLTVADTGVGMDEETREHLFEPFFTTKEVGKGTGLGLSTVYGIIRQSGGFITVVSEKGKGAAFKIYLPCLEEELRGFEACGDASAELPRGTETILLVEDEEVVRTMTKNILEDCGYTVLPASNGKHALEVLAAHEGAIDLLLTDVVMPQMGGRRLAERMKDVRPATRILYMSGYTDDSIIRHGVLEETAAFMEKPYSPETLARKVREILDAYL